MEQYFGIIEAVFVFGLALAFYFWQRRSLARAIAEREARERAEAEQNKDAG
jgi:hypothetical protein